MKEKMSILVDDVFMYFWMAFTVFIIGFAFQAGSRMLNRLAGTGSDLQA